MLKSVLLAGVLGLTFLAPAFAERMKCDEATLTKMKVNVDAMTDKEKQATTIKEWELAMAAMKATNEEECALRMGNVERGVGGQGN